jgi:rRNA maturation endonuclease Nob1
MKSKIKIKVRRRLEGKCFGCKEAFGMHEVPVVVKGKDYCTDCASKVTLT